MRLFRDLRELRDEGTGHHQPDVVPGDADAVEPEQSEQLADIDVDVRIAMAGGRAVAWRRRMER